MLDSVIICPEVWEFPCQPNLLFQPKTETPQPVAAALLTIYPGTIKADSIKIQKVDGINANRLALAFKAALADKYYFHKGSEEIVGNQVALTFGEKRGEWTLTHRIIAQIQSDANQIAIEVSTNANSLRTGFAQVDKSEPEKVFLSLQAGLARTNP